MSLIGWRRTGVSVPWCQETLDALEVYAATEDVSARLRIMEDVARGYAQAGQAQRAQEVALGLIPMGFGVGYRKDYQFQYWVTWLGRAVAESGGERFVEEALWLARLLKAAAPMSERKYPAGAADLPPAVVPGSPPTSCSSLRIPGPTRRSFPHRGSRESDECAPDPHHSRGDSDGRPGGRHHS